MGYVWWRAKNREAAGLADDGLQPEAAELLERHLDPTHEPTLTIRAVYGQWFPYLATVDEEWARHHVSAIFPSTLDLAALRDIAWETYVTFNRAYKNTLELLREEYAVAIEALGTQTPEKRPGHRDREEALVDHLLMLYGHGYLDLDDPLFDAFFAQAAVEVRGHAVEFVGLSLINAGTVSDEAAARFRELWGRRLAAFKAGDTDAEELKGFAWWFSSGELDDAWSLTQLRELLASGGRVDPDRSVAERLAGTRRDAPRGGRCLFEPAARCPRSTLVRPRLARRDQRDRRPRAQPWQRGEQDGAGDRQPAGGAGIHAVRRAAVARRHRPAVTRH